MFLNSHNLAVNFTSAKCLWGNWKNRWLFDFMEYTNIGKNVVRATV